MNALANETITGFDQLTAFSIDGIKKLLSTDESTHPFGWTYLVADKVRFNQKVNYAIHLPKPDTTTLVTWLEKLIISGNTKSIFVEELQLETHDILKLLSLCSFYRVQLISIKTSEQGNLVYGPWQ